MGGTTVLVPHVTVHHIVGWGVERAVLGIGLWQNGRFCEWSSGGLPLNTTWKDSRLPLHLTRFGHNALNGHATRHPLLATWSNHDNWL
jgi:hypothetical protein